MKKTFVFACFFFSLLQFSYVEEASFSQTTKKTKNEYIISPFVGWGAIGVTSGFDFMYRHRSGLLVLCNFDASVPISALGGIVAQGELLLGYAIKRNNLYIGFSGGFWGGGGVSFQGYSLFYTPNPAGDIRLEYDPVFLALFAIRNDYTYFFNERIGITASHTYAAGLHFGPWITFDLITTFSFMAKVGVAFKV